LRKNFQNYCYKVFDPDQGLISNLGFDGFLFAVCLPSHALMCASLLAAQFLATLKQMAAYIFNKTDGLKISL